MTSRDRCPVVVVKLGGSILTGLPSYQRAAEFLRRELRARAGSRIVAVVSAEFGHTDVLAHEAQVLDPAPDARMLDLLWSTGEIRSVALLTLALQQARVQAAGLNAHQAGLRTLDDGGRIEFHLLPIRAALATHDVVVVPGFLATRRQALVTLGRGGWPAAPQELLTTPSRPVRRAIPARFPGKSRKSRRPPSRARPSRGWH